LFYNNDKDWELLIGSANFTNAAFSINTEATSLIGCTDINSKQILSDIFTLIDETWALAKTFDRIELENYKIAWKNFRPKINSLSGRFGIPSNKLEKSKPLHLVDVATMKWDVFMQKVSNDKFHSLDSRIKVIQISKTLFSKGPHMTNFLVMKEALLLEYLIHFR